MLKDLYYYFCTQWKSFKVWRSLRRRFPNCVFEEGVKIKGPIENLMLDEKVLIQSDCLFHLGGMDWCKNQGLLKIGANSVISPGTLIYAAGPGGVVIGAHFDCGPGVKIFSSSSGFYNKESHVFKKVTIGDNVILYSNVVVSPGVTIGNNAIVLAGAVVNKDIPENAVYGGVPAKFIRTKTIQ